LIDGKNILITGGTGSFGKRFTKTVLEQYSPKKVIIFSRDELKQFEMQYDFPKALHPNLRYFLGDIRDKERLLRAFSDVDIVIHAAAMKQVPAAEYNPLEAIKTNVIGAANIVDAAIDCGVEHVVALSTDKAVNPINLYGATKLCSDKLFVAGNAYSGAKKTKFSVVRYGNVVGSRGSVVPFFMKMKETGTIPITDERMTRFWITLDQGVQFVLQSLTSMNGGEIFIPKIPSMKITDLATAIAPNCTTNIVGIRPGEKLHEMLLSEDEARNAFDIGDRYVIADANKLDFWKTKRSCTPVGEDFRYASDTNSDWLTVEQLQTMMETL
jgi:UDP-N-acetylglucosamine 4,6-dehydratase